MPTRSLDKDPLYQGLLLSLPFMEGTGTLGTADVARPHHPVTMTHSPAWVQLANGLWVLDFDGTNDYLSCAAASSTDLDFTTGDFSGCIWVYLDTLIENKYLFSRSGGYGVSGWMFRIHTDNKIYMFTTAAGPVPIIAYSTTVLSTGSWQLLGWSKSGATTTIYWLGQDVSYERSSASPNLTSGANDFFVSRYASGSYRVDGRLWNPRIWGRALSPSEHMSIYKRERHLFGV